MTMIRGNKPMGDPEIALGQPGGTLGDMWGDVAPAYDVEISGGGEFDVGQFVKIFNYAVTISRGGSTATILEFIYPYTGSPTKAVPVGAVGPTQARLEKP